MSRSREALLKKIGDCMGQEIATTHALDGYVRLYQAVATIGNDAAVQRARTDVAAALEARLDAIDALCAAQRAMRRDMGF